MRCYEWKFDSLSCLPENAAAQEQVVFDPMLLEKQQLNNHWHHFQFEDEADELFSTTVPWKSSVLYMFTHFYFQQIYYSDPIQQ